MRPARLLLVGLTSTAAMVAGGCGAGSDEGDDRLNVFAAASLGSAFEEIGEAFEAANPGVQVVLNVAGSSTLAAQIRDGAPADVFAAADLTTMQTVIDAGDVAREPIVFATNSAAIIVAAGNPLDIEGVADLVRDDIVVVQCAPEVPCGAYANEVYRRASVAVTPRSYEQSVSGVVNKVVLGEADAGIVYATDVVATDVAEGVAIPSDDNVVAQYPITALTGAEDPELAAAFVAAVTGAEGQRILAEHGFGRP